MRYEIGLFYDPEVHTYPMRSPAWPVHLDKVNNMMSWARAVVMGV
jgi:hypothetical protein